MQHGRFLSRWRSTLRWALFLFLVASLAAVLEMTLAPAPRWTAREPSIGFLALAPDGRTVVTAAGLDSWNSRPPLKMRDMRTGQERGRFFDGAFALNAHGFVPCLDSTFLISVQQKENGPWQTHIVDGTALTTHPWPLVLRPRKNQYLEFTAKHPLAFVSRRGTNLEKSRCYIVDPRAGQVLKFWVRDEFLHQHVFQGDRLFLGYPTDETDEGAKKWTGFFWDVPKQELIAETDAVESIELSDNQRFVLTKEPVCVNWQRLKVWDIAAAALIGTCLVNDGGVTLSDDGAWAAVMPNQSREIPARENDWIEAALWNLREKRRVGALAVRNGTTLEWTMVNDRPHLLARWDTGEGGIAWGLSVQKSTLQLRDASSLNIQWERTWPEGYAIPWRGQPDQPCRADIAVFGDRIEFLDLATGATRRQLNLANSHLQKDTNGIPAPSGNFLHVWGVQGRYWIIPARYTEKEPPPVHRILDRVKLAWLAPRHHGGQHTWIFALDLETEKICFQSKDYGNQTIAQILLGPNGDSMLIVSVPDSESQLLEIWDVPARKPWPWIVGIPPALGIGGWLGRRLWSKRKTTRLSKT